MQSRNPATGQVIAEYAEHSAEQVSDAAVLADKTFASWCDVSFEVRAELMLKAAACLRRNASRYASLMTAEMGKPIAQSEAEVEKCAWGCEYYAENANGFLADEAVATDAKESGIVYQPLGVILGIMPWNFPFWQVFRFAAPTVMAGNTVLLKHASNMPGCSLAIQEVFEEAGFPPGVFASLLIHNDEALKLIGADAIRAVSLTGSEGAGRAVAAEAGKNLKKCVLELGGSDAFIVLSDADMELTLDGAVLGRMVNGGQSCIAAKRFIVLAGRYEEFCIGLASRMDALKVGDPMDREIQVGPLAREDLVTELHKQVEQSIAAGARLLCGGSRVDCDGFFYMPTVLADVLPGMAAFDEETFGPVAAVTKASSVDEAIALANASRYGLGASIWSKDTKHAQELALQLEAGSVFINGIVKSDPRLSFGGVKNSGYGRELGRSGILEFVNTKSIWTR